MTYHTRAEQLLNVPLFASCSKRDVTSLAKASRVEQIDAGHVVISEGSPSPNLYLILAGTAEVTRGGLTVGVIERGEALGELGVILSEPRSATVTAKTSLELLVLDQDSLQKALDTVPGLGWKLLQTVATRLASAQSQSPI